VRQFLSVEVRGVRGFEVGEVEFLAGAGGCLGLLVGRGCGRGEVEVAVFVEGQPAAFPELVRRGVSSCALFCLVIWERTHQRVRELDIEIPYLHGWRSIAVCGDAGCA
jgi:hypothetical protein